MKAILSSMVLLGALHGEVKSQDYYDRIIDTTLTMPDGSVGRLYMRSFSTTPFCDFPIVSDFQSTSTSYDKSIAGDVAKLRREQGNWNRTVNQGKQLREQLRVKRIALFSEIIGFTASEAQKFWPVYNEYSAKKESLIAKRQEMRNDVRDDRQQLSDAQKTALTDAYINSLRLESDLNQAYYKRFKTMLSPSKLLALYRAEEEFKITMLRTLRDDR